MLKASSHVPTVLSEGICPSGCERGGAGKAGRRQGWVSGDVICGWNIALRLNIRRLRCLSTHLDAVLEAVKLPAAVSGLDTGLADVDGETLCAGKGKE